MKKMIIALDGNHFPKGAFEFAKFINTKSNILLAGVFLSPVDYSNLLAYTGMDGVALMPEMFVHNDEDEVINRNILDFEEACEKEGIEYRVHKDNNMMAIASLVEETRFADVLLVSSELFFNNVSARQPNFYLEEVLKKSECPVMLLPEKFIDPGQVVLAYDGSESSMTAIKQFAYLFPELTQKKTILFSINSEEIIPQYSMVTELVSRHYPDLQVENRSMFDKRDFNLWLDEHPVSYIVMGAFSRSMLSQLFKKSLAAEVIRHQRMPVFISHK
jgi:hypothetical protein